MPCPRYFSSVTKASSALPTERIGEIAPAADELFSAILKDRHHERRHAIEIDIRNLPELGVGEPLLIGEVACVDGLRIEALEGREHAGRVVGTDRSNDDGSTVLEAVGGFVASRVGHRTVPVQSNLL